MGTRGPWRLAIISALSLCAGVRAADEAFPIQVHRPARPGDVFQVHLVFEQTRSETATPATVVAQPAMAPPHGKAPATAASGPATGTAQSDGGAGTTAGITPTTAAPATAAAPTITEHTIKAELTCRVEVVDVNYRGETALWITIGKFVSLADNKDLVPAGKVIGLQGDGMDVYLAVRGGGELSEDARTVLRHVHPLEYQLDEESFGSKTPRKAGESWSVDPVSVSQMDSNAAYAVDPKSVKGQVTLGGAEKAGDVAALRLTVEMAQGGQDRFRKPAGDKIERQELKARISLLYPVDPALPPLEAQIVTDTVAAGTRRVEDRGAVEESNLAIKTHTSEKQTIAVVPP